MKDKKETFEARYDAAEEYIKQIEEPSLDITRLLFAIQKKPVGLAPSTTLPIKPAPGAGRTNPSNASALAIQTGDETLIQLLQLNELGSEYEFDYTPKTN